MLEFYTEQGFLYNNRLLLDFERIKLLIPNKNGKLLEIKVMKKNEFC